MTRSEGHIPSDGPPGRKGPQGATRRPQRPVEARERDDDGSSSSSGHPAGRAALLLVAVTLLIVALAALSSFGHL